MPGLEIVTIGLPEVRVEGELVRFRRRHSTALLAFLALTSRPHSRDELTALLGGDLPDASARKVLRNALADLNAHGIG